MAPDQELGSSTSVDSSDSTSETSHGQHGQQKSHLHRKRRRKETKTQESQERPSQREPKRIRRTHNAKYRAILNKEIEERASQLSQEDEESLNPSQMGMSFWSVEEKEVLFHALRSLGKNQIQEIASRLGTKTEAEVSFYLQCLKRGFQEHNLTASRVRILDARDIPAALEISQECCDALEEDAKFTEAHQQRQEERDHQESFPHLWVLDRDMGVWIEQERCRIETSPSQDDIYAPEFELLRLDNFMELSEDVFMNSANGDTWRNVGVEEDEMPSVLRQAFKDFHDLAVSFLKRLLQTVLFCMTSRIRAMDSRGTNRVAMVKKADVLAACEVLRVKPSPFEFWIGVPRNIGLEVYRNVGNVHARWQRKSVLMSYEEVESSLRSTVPSPRKPARKISLGGRKESLEQHEGDEKGLVRSHDDSEPSEFGDSDVAETIERDATPATPGSDAGSNHHIANSLSSDSQHSETGDSDREEVNNQHTRQKRIVDRVLAKHELERARDAYMEAIDKRDGLEEEQRLWAALRKKAPHNPDVDQVELPPKPVKARVKIEHLVDWRDRMEFWSEWETSASKAPESDFLENSRFQREGVLHNFFYDHSADVDVTVSTSHPAEGPSHPSGTVPPRSNTTQRKTVPKASSPVISRPRPSRTRSAPKSMPGMLPTATALQFSDAEEDSASRAFMRQAIDDNEDEDNDYEV